GLAAGAGEALAAARAGDAPQLLLLDLHLDGIEGTALYPRLCERWQATPPVILVTAERDEALRELCEQSGWGLLSKPVKPPARRQARGRFPLARVVGRPVRVGARLVEPAVGQALHRPVLQRRPPRQARREQRGFSRALGGEPGERGAAAPPHGLRLVDGVGRL